MALPAHRWLEKGTGASLSIKPTAPLDRRQRHAKRSNNLSLAGRAIHDELRGEKSKTSQVLDSVREDRQMAIEVNHLILPPLKGQFRVDGGSTGRKHRQLQ